MNRAAGILGGVMVATVLGIAAVHRLQEQERLTMRGGLLKDQRLMELKRQQLLQEEEFKALVSPADSMPDKPPSSPSS
ncbi:hypothetical protein KP509_06G047900 [Ceratopteris richardii]|uniref:Uncharacterized protein n=1 Tax=Ceratopteris richardii TaxID=49495 RepID=A0A8T2UKJ5_CERRI|nr:hypothetical protein KP509_06G047900 [Ceratopteris richardii]